VQRRQFAALPLAFLGQIGRVRKLHVIGDSTAAQFPPSNARVGWGAALSSQLSGAQVNDRARSGRSSKSYFDEGHFTALLPALAPGDLLLIQFGHNDEKDDAARATDPATTFRDNLRRYVATAREHRAVPVLLTPISRRRFTGDIVTPSHGAFPDATRAVATETATALLDMTAKTAQLLERYGPEASERLFAPDDNTHLSAEGAQAVARLVVAGLCELGFEISPRAHGSSITCYAPPAQARNGAAVVVCPGGGYTHLALEKEGTRAASWLNSLGITAFVLRYRLADWGHPAPLQDVRAAMRLVRQSASAWSIDRGRVGVLGFSAGGHLAACASCLFETADERPDFAALIYPVITLKPPYAHAGSRRALLGATPDPTLVEQLSLETRVTPKTPPTFLMHTRDDASVPFENSQMYQAALAAAGVPSELHLYEHGPHGIGMSPEYEASRAWPKACETWLKSLRMISSP
jgi:acetyl esterase/lipase